MEISLVMPAYKGSEDTITRAIESVLDQDCNDWELIVVVNGQWEKRDKTIEIVKKYMKKDKRILLLLQDEGNSCSSRNYGAEMAGGRIISFFSSDFVMYPGAMTKWLKDFKTYPEYDFIYSGYALLNNGLNTGQIAPSREFDPYLLQAHNYIDGGFPMKREVWEKCKWDPKCKSLNDWDFWLTVVDAGFKGKYVPDATYAAEVPKPGGLSFDSSDNWLERVKFVKDKHKIRQREICLVSYGAPNHGIRLAKLLDADFRVWFKKGQDGKYIDKNSYKMIIVVGFYTGNGDSAIAHTEIFRDFTGKQMIMWIGTDILQLIQAGQKVAYNDLHYLITELDKRKNLVEFEQTQGELASMGLKSDIVPLPIEQNIDVMPLPKKFTVATYVPGTPTARAIYNLDLVEDIIKSCPDINFIAFGGGDLKATSSNLKNIGYKPIHEIMEQSSMLLRLAAHDGMPVAPIEFRLAGRDAMTTVQIPYMYFAGEGYVPKDQYSKRKEAIIGMIRDIKKNQKKSGAMELEKARKYYLALTNPKTFRKKIYGYL